MYRVNQRVASGGHNIPEATIRRRYKVGASYFFKTYLTICDRWILADNSNIPFKVIAEGSKSDIISIKDDAIFKAIRDLAYSEGDF